MNRKTRKQETNYVRSKTKLHFRWILWCVQRLEFFKFLLLLPWYLNEYWGIGLVFDIPFAYLQICPLSSFIFVRWWFFSLFYRHLLLIVPRPRVLLHSQRPPCQRQHCSPTWQHPTMRPGASWRPWGRIRGCWWGRSTYWLAWQPLSWCTLECEHGGNLIDTLGVCHTLEVCHFNPVLACAEPRKIRS